MSAGYDRQIVELDVEMHVDATYSFTTCRIESVDMYGNDIVGFGVAKRNPEDEYDTEVGHSLAIRRALIDLAQQFGDYD